MFKEITLQLKIQVLKGQDKTFSMLAANQPEIHSIFMDVSFFIRRSFYQKVSLLKQIRFCFFLIFTVYFIEFTLFNHVQWCGYFYASVYRRCDIY